MLTALDVLNRLLSYFNIQDKAKGKAFTVVAGAANFYILYLAVTCLRYPGYRIKGVLFLLLFLVLLYFVVLNVIYYYTDKTVPFDISPKVEKLLGGNPERMKEAESALTRQNQSGAASGLFADQQLLPTTVISSDAQQHALADLVDQLVKTGALTLNYQGLDERAVLRVAQHSHQPVSAMGGPFDLPYFRLSQENGHLLVYGGLNALQPVVLGEITQVGLMPVKQAEKDYQLAAAHVFLQGGESKRPGRAGLLIEHAPYTISVQVAYTPRPKVTTPQ